MDRTLTNSRNLVSEKTKNALIKAQELGIILILACGRPISGLVDLSRELKMDKHHGVLVSFN